MKKTIVYLSTYAGFIGGIERYMANTSQILRKAGYRTEMYYIQQARLFDEFSKEFDRVAPLEKISDFASAELITIHKLTDSDMLQELLNTVADKTLLVVHDHDIYCPRRHKYIPFGRKNCFRPYQTLPCALCAAAVSPGYWKSQGVVPFLKKLTCQFRQNLELYRQFPRVAVLSEYMRGNLVMNGFSPDAVRVIHPAIELPQPQSVSRDSGAPPNLISVGQLIRGKGVEAFLRMAALLRHDFTAQIIGDGSDRPRLEALCSKLGLSERVQFTGWRSDPENVYAQADIAVYPFLWQEPFGLVGLEASAYGVPVVAYDRGGCAEWLTDDVNGVLIKPDDLSSLAAAVNTLLSSPEKRKHLGLNGRAVAEMSFSPERLLEQYEELL